ncbi:MAG: hypothetical protein WD470_11945, partial [Rhodospirillaceae bacterium]
EGCRLVRDVRRDEILTYDDVECPPGRLVDGLRAEQAALFHAADGGEASPAYRLSVRSSQR